MKSISLFSVLILSAVFFEAQANLCVDGRLVRIDCRQSAKVLTSYGCDQEYFVQCLPLAEIPLIEGVTSGGFRRYPQIDMTTIKRDGKVIQTRKEFDRTSGQWKVSSAEFLTLGKQVLTQIDKSFEVLVSADFMESNEPRCMDAPTTIFTAYVVPKGEASTTAIPFYKIEDCIRFVTKSPGVWDLRNISESVDTLGNYAL